ncbi:unnamed protein product, partial [Pylaiella littoralis]
GEVLTALGGVLLLCIDFGWPALVSVLSSIFAFLVSTRRNMRVVGIGALGAPDLEHLADIESFEHISSAELYVPGPIAFLKLVSGVPVWPLSLVAWGVYKDRDMSNDFVWVWPPSWLRASDPSVDRVLDWILFP